jgi:hypothetical protein
MMCVFCVPSAIQRKLERSVYVADNLAGCVMYVLKEMLCNCLTERFLYFRLCAFL